MSHLESYPNLCGDGTFGPAVPRVAECRGGFDFTETKEKTRILLPKYSKISSELRTGLFSRAFFIWLIPVLTAGFKGVISHDGLPVVNEKLSSESLTARVESRWKDGNLKGKHALMFDVLFSFPKELFVVLFSYTIQVGLQICQPFLIQELVTFLESPSASMNIGYGLLGAFFCVSIGNALLIPWCFHYSSRLMIMARGALVSMIYSKLLHTRDNDSQRMTSFTLMTTDVEKIVDVCWRLLEPVPCLAQIGIGTYLLYRQLGASSWFQAIESRIGLTAHVLSSLHSVKLLGLSRRMEDKIHGKRKSELQVSQKFRLSNCFAMASAFAPQSLAPLVTFGAYSIMKMVSDQSNFSVTTAVTSLSILNLITTPGVQLLLAIPMGAQAVGGFSRIQTFLQQSETSALTTPETSNSIETNASMMVEKTADSEPRPLVHHPQLSHGQHMAGNEQPAFPASYFQANSILAITGPVGCGKSTALKRVLLANGLKESCLSPSAGVAYCSQTPWIYEGTIRDNIIGQSELDDKWYNSILRACELEVDISSMPDGDATMVGSRGSKLSGGQRQRIAIARALYSNKPQAIFDDVTSALDGRTLSAVSDKVFGRNGILRSRGTSVVLSTHAVQLLQLVDVVLLMNKDGEVIDSGTYEQLAERHESFVPRQVLGSSRSSSGPDKEFQNLAIQNSRGEYQSQLHTRVNDLRRQKGDWRSFSQDIRLCDWQLPFNILLTLFAFLACLASLGIAVAAVPYMAVGTPVLAAVLYLLQLSYLRTSRQLRLLEIELKAPMASLFLDTIYGITTIQAFGWSKAYVQKGFSLLDASQRPYYLLFCVQRWLILVLALIVTGLEVLVIGLAIALKTKVSAGLVGLAAVQVTTLTQGLSDLVMQWTEMETSLGAVSRIYKYTHETPREAHLGERIATLPGNWPSTGSITFEGISATYRQGSPSLALDNITFAVKHGERVGICGRTGSGKSSLMAALLCLLPCHQGRILIDNVDISTLDPEVVRSKLNYVTQEPFLINGTIRENLSPWADEVPDCQMIQALKQVELWSKIEALGGLDAQLEDETLSHGQRQLLCLSRALLRESHGLILDEPTGHIDPATDATIQRVIREGFPGRTIIMIAHRLESLVTLDNVIVMESGRVIETGPPKRLLSDPSSSFSTLYHAVEEAI
ncbi:hypothetical protein C2857_003221 [Epichloe festucae Fl1]|uniref:ABC transporter n=1 Tax=Epichloe festucae (strain Fl1) TaxID=877507 RepID=A0A7U3Q0D2_EPIFF|nr:hypothetical protein C2857_003221 [Epichloe festucae Fl1]